MAIKHMIGDWLKRRKAVKAHLRGRQPTTLPGQSRKGRSTRAGVARALPRLPSREARIRRAIIWKIFRPVIRWHRRTPVAVVRVLYLGVAGSLYLALVYWLAQPAPSAMQPSGTPAAASDHPVTLGLEVPASTVLFPDALDPGDFAALEAQADEAFRRGDFSEAEVLYRKILPQSRFPGLTQFHIFLCLLEQDKSAEAQLLADNVPRDSVPRNPLQLYIPAVYAIRSGRPGDAAESMARARALFPKISIFYDKALREAGMELP